VLARLEADDTIEAAYLSQDGTRLLIGSEVDVDLARVTDGCKRILAEVNLQPRALSGPETTAAWNARDDVERWVRGDTLWKLSMREAKTFADRILVVLVERYGDAAKELLPVLVDHCFEGVRPANGSGPAPTRWKPGTSIEDRRAVILKKARARLKPQQVTDLGKLLADRKQMTAIVRAGR
jgi:hypothetical protein